MKINLRGEILLLWEDYAAETISEKESFKSSLTFYF